MNPLNVFNNPYYRWRYPDCWLKNARMFFRSFKYAYQRITRGWANCDTWDLDSYYSKIFNGTLNYLADNHWGYPGNNQFPDDESWTKYLKVMAQKFYQCDESNALFYPGTDHGFHQACAGIKCCQCSCPATGLQKQELR